MPYDVPSHSQSTAEMDVTYYKPVPRVSRHHSFSDSLSSPTITPSTSTSRPATPKPFTYDLTRKGKTWGKLTLLGDPALSRSNAAFVEPAEEYSGEPASHAKRAHAPQMQREHSVQKDEGATVRGEVQLNLDSPEMIHSVKVTVRGQLSIGASAPFTFLDVSTMLWSREMGDPRGEGLGAPHPTKLRGTYTWPFAIPLPRAVVLPVGSPPRERRYALPANFWERHEPVRVRYHVILQVGRGAWRGDLRLPVEFTYIPLSAPPPASLARQLAYQEKEQIPPPEADVEGWHRTRSVVVSGLVGEGRYEVEVTCCVSCQLAVPQGLTDCEPIVLAYTRGSIIPLALTLESHDAAALDLLSAPTAPVARLRRRLRYKADIGKVDEEEEEEGADSRGRQTTTTTPWQDSTTVYDLASWWPCGGAQRHTYRRCMDGEIHLKEDLRPSTAFAHWRVEYEVVLFPFDISSFVGRDKEPLVVQPVEIATAYGPGPRPRAFTAPAYEFASQVPLVGSSLQ
ncbi:hypothetical protein K525DRAFT_204668 [Schizophyllum commune Loenen D]|nr:hypothetical protein K525DRAFT_204668 [Schizophyllum commune Loenen D]